MLSRVEHGKSFITSETGVLVAQWVKCWPTDLASRVRVPSRGNLCNHKWGSTAHSLSLSSAHCPDMTEIWLKRM